MTKQIFIFFLSWTLYSCSAQDCKEISNNFTSYQEAQTLIEKSEFAYIDKVNTEESSWIRSAKFYSCDKKSGYFIIVTDKEKYIHRNLPIEIWKNFKSEFVNEYNLSGKRIPRSFLINPAGQIIAKDLRGDEIQKNLRRY